MTRGGVCLEDSRSSEQRRCSFQKTTSPSSGSTRRAAGCLLLAPPLCALDTSPRYLSAIPGQRASPPPLPLSPISQKKRRSVFFFPPKLLKSTKERQRGRLRSLPLVSVKSLLFFFFCDYFLFAKNRNENFRNNALALFHATFRTRWVFGRLGLTSCEGESDRAGGARQLGSGCSVWSEQRRVLSAAASSSRLTPQRQQMVASFFFFFL